MHDLNNVLRYDHETKKYVFKPFTQLQTSAKQMNQTGVKIKYIKKVRGKQNKWMAPASHSTVVGKN